MWMFEFIINFGFIGLIGIIILFITVLILAKPNKEISFFGIKFHKKEISIPFYLLRKYPKSIPESWITIFTIFQEHDEQYINKDIFYNHAKIENKGLQIRHTIEEMKKYGLIQDNWNNISLTKRGLKKLNRKDF